MLFVIYMIFALPIFGSNVFESVNFTSEEVTALVKFHKNENGKMFGAQWFDKSEFGLINMGLVLIDYSVDVKEGFKLGEAKVVQFVSPKLPEGCRIKSFKGNLNWMQNAVSSISTNLSGSSCKDFIDTIDQTPIEILFSDVPHMMGSKGTKSLLLKVIEAP